ncbi:hypothetical protein SZN_31144 [Streptomyces zinciresistens K42]|uniref:DUF4232 domain-containing protein n=1 Tax=Streptomyces zinciresistens K42 TaxID=700597 RepID=G2GL33_9ACTN|nr:DUF4232 domain-containing protein [Streptomyces zinciresistens]EGX55776.1 hypothetical protein SZN_31144 [Streptomyces zinciresistens K42]
MSGNRRKALLVSAAVLGGALLMTACKGTEPAGDGAAAQSSPAVSAAGGGGASSGSPDSGGGKAKEPAKGSGASSGDSSGATSGGEGSGVGTGGGREEVGQVCGANDISWKTRSESQAGGYVLVMAKAKPGITCYLPAALPTVAFGSDGTEAGPAEQSAGKEIKLSGSVTAYAGVNPKTTNTDDGKELDSIILAVGNEDPEPVSLPVGTITVDKPVVTNWHTAPADAVPFG